MIDLYSFIKDGDLFPKMEVSELLFVKYTCMSKYGLTPLQYRRQHSRIPEAGV